jgi:hypothetical protein
MPFKNVLKDMSTKNHSRTDLLNNVKDGSNSDSLVVMFLMEIPTKKRDIA